jgi:hypothetical protein
MRPNGAERPPNWHFEVTRSGTVKVLLLPQTAAALPQVAAASAADICHTAAESPLPLQAAAGHYRRQY